MRTIGILASLLCTLTAHASTLTASSYGATYSEASGTGAQTLLADPAGGATASPLLISLTTDPKGAGAVYGLDVGGWPTLPAELVRFDAAGLVDATAQLTYQGAPVLVAEGLAFAPSGKLWVAFGTGADYEFYESGHMGELDPATGVIDPASVVTLSGYHNTDADVLEFVGGSLYMTDNRIGEGTSLYTVNASTGATTLIGLVQGAAGAYQVADLAWDGSSLYGEAYTADGRGQLILIDRRTGAATEIGAPHEVITGLTLGAEACTKKACK